MLKNVYVYEMPPTDWFFPFKTLEQTILDAEAEALHEDHYLEIKQSILAKVDRAKRLFKKHTLWEGDGHVYISSLPSDYGDSFPLILVVIKQSNNGTTFLYSPVILPHLKEYLKKAIEAAI